MVHSLSQRLVARYFAILLATSGVVSALVHPLPNLTDMSGGDRSLITAVCVVGGGLIWVAPWDRWPRWTLFSMPLVGLGVKMWANLLGGLGPYSYALHFALIYVWMGVALPRGSALAFAPLLALAYALPLGKVGDPKQMASVAMVVPICVVIGESVAWISNRLREVEGIDGQRMQRMAWLVDATVELANEQDQSGVAERVARLAVALPGAVGAVVLLPGSGRGYQLAAQQDWPGDVSIEDLDLGGDPALVEAMRSGRPIGAEDGRCLDLARCLGVSRLGIAPLVGSKRCSGLVLLARRPASSAFDGFTEHLVGTLCVQAGLALERVELGRVLREASLHDELTGLGNRRKANSRLAELAPGDALMLIDLDHFKRVNDTRGHAAGDAVLRELARFLTETLRRGDHAFRLGGEEFLVVLREAGDGAAHVAERLRAGWSLLGPVATFSAGVALHAPDQRSEATLDLADRALYAAKDAGRNRVELASPSAP